MKSVPSAPTTSPHEAIFDIALVRSSLRDRGACRRTPEWVPAVSAIVSMFVCVVAWWWLGLSRGTFLV